jgi:hypothetical protein
MVTKAAPLPHKKRIVQIAIAAIIAVLAIESTAAGAWMHETGVIHAIAVIFTLLALRALYVLRNTPDGSIRLFARYAAAAIAFAGSAHVVEYFGDTMKLISEEVIILAVGSMYLFAGMLIVFGAHAMLRRAGESAEMPVAAIIMLLVIQAVLAWLLLEEGAPLGPITGALGMVLFFSTVTCTEALWRLSRKFPLLVNFTRNLTLGACLIFVSFLFEVFFESLEHAGFAEALIENAAHYFFYLGMTIMLFSFDLLRHFGGVYADIQKEAAPHGE